MAASARERRVRGSRIRAAEILGVGSDEPYLRTAARVTSTFGWMLMGPKVNGSRLAATSRVVKESIVIVAESALPPTF